MLGMIRGANMLLRLLLEVVAVIAVFARARQLAGGGVGFLYGVAAGAAFALAWGLFAAPKARIRLAGLVRELIGVALLLVGAAAFGSVDSLAHGELMAVLVVANAAMLRALPVRQASQDC